MAFLKGLFQKKTPAPKAELQIGSPNGLVQRDDANEKLPVVNGLMRSHEEQVKLSEELIASGLKALPVKSKMSAPNDGGQRDNAKAIRVKDGLDAKTTPPVPSAKIAEDRLMIDRRTTIYKPMPQKVDVAEQPVKSPEDILKSELDDLLADLKRDNEARNRGNEARSKTDAPKKDAPKKGGDPVSQTVNPNAGIRPVPPPKPEHLRSNWVKTLKIPDTQDVTSPQQPGRPVLPPRAKQMLAENTFSGNAAKGTQLNHGPQLAKPAQSHGLGHSGPK